MDQVDQDNSKLIEAYRTNNVPGVISALREGGDLNVETSYFGGPLLVFAARNGQIPFVDALLREGADPDAMDAAGWTSLQSAANAAGPDKYTVVARLLLDHGASVDAKNSDQGTALIYACTQGSEGMALIKLLLEHGADPTVPTFMGTPLKFAIGLTSVPEMRAVMQRYIGRSSSEGKASGCLTFIVQVVIIGGLAMVVMKL